MQREKNTDILQLGCTTKDATNIITSIGWIMAIHQTEEPQE